ncbi:MAG: vWA domain-containing protein [Thermotogota bacterium]|nr:vWA domain-containing protein [Thermotogota bacterium]
MKREIPLFFIILVIISSMTFSSLTIHSIDRSDFPFVRLNISGERLSFKNIEIFEEGIPAKIKSIEIHSSVLRKPIDIVLVIDNSGTMEPRMNYVKNKADELLEKMSGQGYNVRFSVMGFGSEVNTEFTGGFSHFTYSVEQTKRWIEKAASFRGGRNECQIEALRVASNYDFRYSASKLIILFTDEDTKQNKINEFAINELKENIIDSDITIFIFYSDPDKRFNELTNLSGGILFPFNGGNFVERIDEMFMFYEFYATIEYVTQLSFPDFSSGEQITVKVMNKETDSSVSNDYLIPEIEKIEDIEIVSVITVDFPAVTANVNVTTSGEKQLEFFNITENQNKVEPVAIESLDCIKKSTADFLIVLDTTSSMIQELGDVVSNLKEFINALESSHIDARIGLITFGDEIRVREGFSKDFEYIKNILEQQVAYGGGDVPEIALDASYYGLSMNFRESAQRFMILITDAKPHYLGDGTELSQVTAEDVRNKFSASKTSLILVGPLNIAEFEELTRVIPGGFRNIKSKKGFGDVVNKISTEITTRYRIKYISPDTEFGTERLLSVAYGTIGATTTYTSPGPPN